MKLDRDRALSHPTRTRIVELLGEGPRTGDQLAEALRQSLESVIYHSLILLKAGFIAAPGTPSGESAPFDRAAPLTLGSAE